MLPLLYLTAGGQVETELKEEAHEEEEVLVVAGEGEEKKEEEEGEKEEEPKGPMYVPRKGRFFQHDDRGGDEQDEAP